MYGYFNNMIEFNGLWAWEPELLWDLSAIANQSEGPLQAVIDGTPGDDVLFDTLGGDIISGLAGNDTLTGGSARDIFEFLSGFGSDTVTDFENNRDKIDFSGHFGFNSISDVLAVATQVGADTVIALDASNTLTLQNFALSDLDGRDFKFIFSAEQATEVKVTLHDENDSFVFVDKPVVFDDLIAISTDLGDFGIDQNIMTEFLVQADILLDNYVDLESAYEIGPETDNELTWFADFYSFA